MRLRLYIFFATFQYDLGTDARSHVEDIRKKRVARKQEEDVQLQWMTDKSRCFPDQHRCLDIKIIQTLSHALYIAFCVHSYCMHTKYMGEYSKVFTLTRVFSSLFVGLQIQVD